MASKNYFVISDIHSFYTEMKIALKQAGFNKQNKNHTLIICGDLFDRGDEALKVYKFIQSIPKPRRILIRGNHEELFLKLLNKGYPSKHDFSNGTVDTFCQLANQQLYTYAKHQKIRTSEWLALNYRYCADELQEQYSVWEDIRNTVARSEITKWLKSDEWKDYYELDKYIFVHSFIPVSLKKEYEHEIVAHYSGTGESIEAKDSPGLVNDLSWFEYNQEWRNKETSWKFATWGCPWEQYKANLFKVEEDNGKVLVCGHWHTSDFYTHLKNISIYNDECAPIYFSKGLIGIDGGCMYDFYFNRLAHPQNVLVIKDNICYDKFGNKLVEVSKTEKIIIETVTIDEDGSKINNL